MEKYFNTNNTKDFHKVHKAKLTFFVSLVKILWHLVVKKPMNNAG